MAKIVVFSEEETELINSILDVIRKKRPEEAEYISNRLIPLNQLAQAISKYLS